MDSYPTAMVNCTPAELESVLVGSIALSHYYHPSNVNQSSQSVDVSLLVNLRSGLSECELCIMCITMLEECHCTFSWNNLVCIVVFFIRHRQCIKEQLLMQSQQSLMH